jgi:HAT1-interacting factor 1
MTHVQAALAGFKERRTQLQAIISSNTETSGIEEEVKKMSVKEREGELGDVEALIGDLESKIEELKTAPAVGGDLVSKGIEHLLGGGSGAFGEGSGAGKKDEDQSPVNDLTSMVKKKAPKKIKPSMKEEDKPEVIEENREKRKGDDVVGEVDEKRARVD